MKRFTARQLAAMPKPELWALPDEDIEIVFDDGVIVSDIRLAIFSTYMWGLYNIFPRAPTRIAHHVGNRRINPSTHLKMIDKVRWDIFDAYGGDIDNEKMSKLCIEEYNIYYNDMIEYTEPFITTLGMKDLNAVMCHPRIKAANDDVLRSASDVSIKRAYDIIESVLMDPKEIGVLARCAKSGLVKMGQVKQCVGPRGPVTEIDSTLFPYPARTGFIIGLYRFYDSFVESRTASKALTFTEKPLQETEYFNRKLQLLAETLSDIYDGDCGTTYYLDWFFKAGQERFLAGKYYLRDDGTLGVIRNDEATRRELADKNIKIRSVLYCNTPDSTRVCSTCYGEMQHSIPHGTNIGHVAATALCKQASQQVLSVKHLDSSTANAGLRLEVSERKYIRTGIDPNQIFLTTAMAGKKLKMFIASAEAERLPDVRTATRIDVLLPTQISSLTQATFVVTEPGREPMGEIISISNGSRTSSLSREMLVYLKENSWKLTEDGDIEIDLEKWDHDLPILTTPRRQENMLDYMSMIEKFLKAVKRGGAVKSLKDYDTVDQALMGFTELVSSRLSVNVVHLEILVKVCTIRSSRDRDYRIPLLGNKVEFGKFDLNIFYRSEGGAMAYQQHRQQWNSPVSYLITKRPPHPLDPILLPRPTSK